MRLTELASLAGMTKQSIGEMVDDLVDLGYVERIPDPEDRRAKLICLTERGEEAQRIGFGLFAKVEQRWAERYGAERIAAAARAARGDRHRRGPRRRPRAGPPRARQRLAPARFRARAAATGPSESLSGA